MEQQNTQLNSLATNAPMYQMSQVLANNNYIQSPSLGPPPLGPPSIGPPPIGPPPTGPPPTTNNQPLPQQTYQQNIPQQTYQSIPQQATGNFQPSYIQHGGQMPPPHSGGSTPFVNYQPTQPGQPGQPSRIDTANVPSIIPHLTPFSGSRTIYQSDRSGQNPPSAVLRDLALQDYGNSTPKFFRMTLNYVPTSSDLLTTCGLPLAAVLQPFADTIKTMEGEVPLVDFGEVGPLRCKRCRAYINPWVSFGSEGHLYYCSLCNASNEVPSSYFCPLTPTGSRADRDSRPELSRGTVDFVATEEYISSAHNPPQPLSYLFLIDVTASAQQSGFLHYTIHTIKSSLSLLSPLAHVGIVTYDEKGIYFFNLKSGKDTGNIPMYVVADLEDVFVPGVDVLINRNEYEDQITTLLDKLPTLFPVNPPGVLASLTPSNGRVLGPAVEAAGLALNLTGGKIIGFVGGLASLPGNYGNGGLTRRDIEYAKVLGTDKEMTGFWSPNNKWFESTGSKFSEKGIGVDLFVAVQQQSYCDTITLNELCRTSGGELRYYGKFEKISEKERFMGDLRRNLSRYSGYDGLMRIRTGNGIQVKEIIGNLYTKDQVEYNLGTVDADRSYLINFGYDSKIDSAAGCVGVQTAVLYTNRDGQRRIRVCNISFRVTSDIAEIYRGADLDAIIAWGGRTAGKVMLSGQGLAPARSGLITGMMYNSLLGYRKYGAPTSGGLVPQLMMPESLKLLPLYALALLKSDMLRPFVAAGRNFGNVWVDERLSLVARFQASSVVDGALYAYPMMFPFLKNVNNIITENNSTRLPLCQPLTYAALDTTDIHVIDDGRTITLWIGKNVPSDVLVALFEMDSLIDADMKKLRLLPLQNPLSQKMQLVIRELRENSPVKMEKPVTFVVQGAREESESFIMTLVEDKVGGQMGYHEFLGAIVHKYIQEKLQ